MMTIATPYKRHIQQRKFQNRQTNHLNLKYNASIKTTKLWSSTDCSATFLPATLQLSILFPNNLNISTLLYNCLCKNLPKVHNTVLLSPDIHFYIGASLRLHIYCHNRSHKGTWRRPMFYLVKVNKSSYSLDGTTRYKGQRNRVFFQMFGHLMLPR